jgi:hypothetical protein
MSTSGSGCREIQITTKSTKQKKEKRLTSLWQMKPWLRLVLDMSGYDELQ